MDKNLQQIDLKFKAKLLIHDVTERDTTRAYIT